MDLSFDEFAHSVLTYMAWVFTGDILDKEKRVFFRVKNSKAEIAVKSNTILVNEQLNANINCKDEWVFVLDYFTLKKIVETYSKMSATYIDRIHFIKDEHGVIIELDELVRDGYNFNIQQKSRFFYGQPAKINTEKLFDSTQHTALDGEVPDFIELLDALVPKMNVDTRLQFEGNTALLRNENIYGYRNTNPNILKRGTAYTSQECIFLRQLFKKNKQGISYGETGNHLIILWENKIAMLTKIKIIKPLEQILKHEPFLWEMTVNGGYFFDLLRRFNKDDDITMVIQGTNLKMKTKETEQTIPLSKATKEADGKSFVISKKALTNILLTASEEITLSFIEKKSRGRATHYLCYATDHAWIAVTQVRKVEGK